MIILFCWEGRGEERRVEIFVREIVYMDVRMIKGYGDGTRDWDTEIRLAIPSVGMRIDR